MSRLEMLGLTLTESERVAIRRRLGREGNPLELSIIDAEWSEHCSYKSSKHLLKLLPTTGKRVLLGPGFDAGVLDIGDGDVATLHIESHNHPSAIDPYGGAATGVGGILRDILSMGTRPIALLDSLRFGRIEKNANSKWLFQYVVRGIADYGNCTGVPTVGGEVEFDESFERNCLVDVVSLGIGKKKDIVLAMAKNPGDPIILVGGRTGRDGIHGSTFASRTLSGETSEDRSAVQIPDPFTKKQIIEATLEAIKTGYVTGLKDLGASGIAGGVSEIAYAGGTGVEIELSKVHLREDDLQPHEIMISESQERMVFVVKASLEEEVCRVFQKYGLLYSIIGRVTDTKRMVVRKNGKVLADLPVEVVVKAEPALRAAKKPSYIGGLSKIRTPEPKRTLEDVIMEMIASPNLASKRWVYQQYDHEVGVRTVVKPGLGASVLRVSDDKFLAIKVDGDPKHCYLDPYHGAAGILAEACRNVIAVGAEPIAMVDHLQFGNPGNPEVYWTFAESIRGFADYCMEFGIPCVGGKVSFYNEDTQTGVAIKPTPLAAVLGLIENVEHITSTAPSENASVILQIGETRSELGGSEYCNEIFGMVGGKAPKVDFEAEKASQRVVRDGIRTGLIGAANDCSSGGLLIAVAEMSMLSGVGASIDLEKCPSVAKRWDEVAFSESHSRFVIATSKTKATKLKELARKHGVKCSEIGVLKGNNFTVRSKGKTLASLPVEKMKSEWEMAIPRLMGDAK
jgi:phosphoribosylformylglycinamidine synthase